MKEFFLKRALFIFLCVLFLLVFNRFSYMYLNDMRRQQTPESYFSMDRVGMDLRDGLVIPVYKMLAHQPFDAGIGYGQGLTAVTAVAILPLQQIGVCTPEALEVCTDFLYRVQFVFVFFGFFLMVLLLPYGEDRAVAGVILATFFLGYPGSMGMDRGNLDILFSFVFFVFVVLRMRKARETRLLTAAGAVVMTLMTSAKLTTAPFLFAFMVTSAYPFLFAGSAAVGYVVFSYLPMLFMTGASLLDPFKAAIAFQNRSSLADVWCSPYNHNIFSVTSLVFPCKPWVLPYVAAAGIFLFIAVMAFALRNGVKRTRSSVFFILIALSAAAMNLLPTFSNAYRLYYSLVVVLAFWLRAKGREARWALLWASVFLLVRGAYVYNLRAMNIVLLVHYYFLVRAAVLL